MKLRHVKSGIKAARKAERKGDLAVAADTFTMAILGALSTAVSEKQDSAEAVSLMRDVGLEAVLSDYCRINEELGTLVARREAEPTCIGGNFHLLVFVHIAWLMNNQKLSKRFSALANMAEVMELSTRFWREYAHAIDTFLRHKPYALTEFQLRGQEKYWYVYLEIIEAFTNGRDIRALAEKAASIFETRNMDKRIKDDNYKTEGSALHPTKWDYRLESLVGMCG